MDGAQARAHLGVPAHATTDEIQRAFRRAVRRAHPDRGGDGAIVRLLVEARDRLLPLATAPSAVERPALDRSRRTDPFTALVTVPTSAFSAVDIARTAPVAPDTVAGAEALLFEAALARALAEAA